MERGSNPAALLQSLRAVLVEPHQLRWPLYLEVKQENFLFFSFLCVALSWPHVGLSWLIVARLEIAEDGLKMCQGEPTWALCEFDISQFELHELISLLSCGYHVWEPTCHHDSHRGVRNMTTLTSWSSMSLWSSSLYVHHTVKDCLFWLQREDININTYIYI